MSDWLGLEGRAVVVAGAGGFGAACAVAFADAGARVTVIDRDEVRLDALHTEATTRGLGLKTIEADLSTADACREAIASASSILGGIDVFLHAIGINNRRPVLDTSDETWHDILTINLSSAFWLGQAAGRIMCASRGGRMVFLSSVSGRLAHADHSPYAASKGGVDQMMKVMAREWAHLGVGVNAVAPGYTETDLTKAYLDADGHRAELTGLVPAARLGSIDDVVGPVMFLSSEKSAFVTGHVMYVDGGRILV